MAASTPPGGGVLPPPPPLVLNPWLEKNVNNPCRTTQMQLYYSPPWVRVAQVTPILEIVENEEKPLIVGQLFFENISAKNKKEIKTKIL